MKCLKCGLPKSINDFPTDPSGRPRPHCYDCLSQLQHEEEVESTKTFFVSQGESCPICLSKMPYGVVDSSHEMGHRSGMICQGCNALLGKLRGNHEVIDEAIAKLQRAKQYLLERDLYSREDHELKIYYKNKPYAAPGLNPDQALGPS
ncbi:MAG TPA: endonuclease domain-containing protein [Chthoniobacterales bacterium]